MSDPAFPEAALRERADRIVIEALDLPDERRAAFLDACCGDDAPLRRLVDSLLAEVHLLDGFLDEPILDAYRDGPAPHEPGGEELIGRRIGPWRILREIGRGGMGLVFEVERDDGVVRQRAALKLIRRGMDSEAIVARFHTERQILAALDHPHIARLIDGGATDDGRPYLVMERVDGLPLDRWCAANDLSVDERLALFVVICGAVQYAHQRLVVHRDLKPSNILVTRDGQPKLLDFGVAKLLDPDTGVDATLDANRLLTPRYASPEQLGGTPVSTASDVYALGVLLYELTTGRAPYRVVSTSVIEMLRAIAEQEPIRPSLAVTRPASARPSTASADATAPLASDAVERQGRRLAQRLRGDIDHIVLKALAKEVEQRYGSAAELRDDLARHLAGEPIHATVPTWRYRARKFVGRNRAAVAAAGVAVVALVVGTGIATWQAVRADRQRDLAEARFQDTRKLARSMLFEINDELSSGPTAAREKLVRTALDYLDRLASERLEPDLQRDVASGYERIADIVGNPGQNNLGRPAEARRYFDRALVLRERLWRAHPGNAADVTGMYYVNKRIGELLRYSGPAEEADRYFAVGERFAREEVALRPGDPDAIADVFSMRRYRAGVLFTQGRPNLHRLADAMVQFARLADDIDAHAAAHGSTARIDVILGVVLAELTSLQRYDGRFAEAATTARRGLEVGEARLRKSPDDSVVLRDVAIAKRRLGDVLADLGRGDEAVRAVSDSLAMFERQVANDPGNTRARRDLGILHETLGTLHLNQGRERAAIDEYLAWLAFAEREVAADPATYSHRLDRDSARDDVAAARLGAGDVERARVEAHAASAEIVARDGTLPHDERAREALGDLRLIEARALAAQKRADEAWPLATDGVHVFEENVRANPGDLIAVRVVARAAIEAGAIGLDAAPDRHGPACDLVRRGREQLRALDASGRLGAPFKRYLVAGDKAAERCVAIASSPARAASR